MAREHEADRGISWTEGTSTRGMWGKAWMRGGRRLRRETGEKYPSPLGWNFEPPGLLPFVFPIDGQLHRDFRPANLAAVDSDRPVMVPDERLAEKEA